MTGPNAATVSEINTAPTGVDKDVTPELQEFFSFT
jgi:hypothetical protein